MVLDLNWEFQHILNTIHTHPYIWEALIIMWMPIGQSALRKRESECVDWSEKSKIGFSNYPKELLRWYDFEIKQNPQNPRIHNSQSTIRTHNTNIQPISTIHIKHMCSRKESNKNKYVKRITQKGQFIYISLCFISLCAWSKRRKHRKKIRPKTWQVSSRCQSWNRGKIRQINHKNCLCAHSKNKRRMKSEHTQKSTDEK